MVGDRLVHHRLGKCRLVGLVVTEAAIGPDVEDHVLPEGVPELGRDARDVDHGFHVVAVDVEDRRLHELRDLGGVARGARRRRAGGEADLVVDDQMDRSAGPIAGYVGETEGLRHDSLARERRVAVHQDAEDTPAFGIPALALLRPDLADDDGIDRLEMGRVGGKREMDLDAVELPVGGSAQVILHVARAADLLRLVGHAAELGEDRRVGLVHDVGEHVEAAAMRHAQHDLLDPELRAALEDLFQGRDQRFAAVEPEPLGPRIPYMEKLLEGFGFHQPFVNGLLAALGEVGLVVDRLDTVLDPDLLLGGGDVHVFHADGAAIGLAQSLDDLPQGGALETERVDVDRPVVVGLGEAVALGVELAVRRRLFQLERVEIAIEMAADPVGPDQGQRLDRIPRRLTQTRPVRDRWYRPGGNIAVRGRLAGTVVDDPRFPGRPTRPFQGVEDFRRFVAKVGEESRPLGIDRGGIGNVSGVKLLDERPVRAGEEAGLRGSCHRLWLSLSITVHYNAELAVRPGRRPEQRLSRASPRPSSGRWRPENPRPRYRPV